MKIKIKNEEIRQYLDINTPQFSKYATQIINLANQNAQGTRPKVVGQMSDLIKQFTGKKLSEWEKWYLNQKPEAVKAATDKIWEMVKHLDTAMDKIDRQIVEQWVRDLVIVKTFIGLRFQEAILKKIAEIKNCKYRLAEPKDESRGIDGFIEDTPVSIKPDTYKIKASLPESLPVKPIYYKKIKTGIEIEYEL